ncbi:MAG TPA: DUF1223 domain-containing protein [Candidatus Acidoferrum sp.]|nr:DUF1223 domain-containing protein [Candidatus Acidoferrum sp.]
MSLKHWLASLILFAALVSATALTRAHGPMAAETPQTFTPVVVELFTSEGCSSCPPADALLARLDGAQLKGNVQLIALEEHVDYWNDGGWVDPFSSREWTSRQYDYAATLKNGNPYTPQMVVDGTIEFVGNHPDKAHDAILKAASKTKTTATLTLGSATGTGKENISVKVGKLEGTTQGDTAEVWLAITETGLHSSVTRGENAGEELHHAAIVRSMRKIGEARGDGDTSFAGNASVPLKKEWKHENLRAVLFVQEKKSRRILGAAEIRIAG